jgi:Tol biopolymer transport system component
MRRFALVIMACAFAAAMLPIAPAEAAFPGSNGVIAFSSLRDGNRNIYVHDLTIPNPGPNEFQLTTSVGDDFTPALDPAGTHIVFMSQRKDPPTTGTGKARIWTLNLNHSGSTWSSSNETDVSGTSPSTPAATQPSWSRDGTQIVYVSAGSPHSQIFVMNADGTNKHAVLTAPDGCDDTLPAWSPVADRIAYTSQCGTHAQIFVVPVNATGTQVGPAVNLSNNAFSDTKPDWSPDGSKLAFASDATGSSQIYSMSSSDGSSRTQLTTDLNDNGQPAWSPDGAQIVYASHLDTTSVVTMAVPSGGGSPTVVTPQTNSNDEPNWGPVPGSSPVTPEVPYAIALPGIAMLAVGTYGWRRRRLSHA